MPGSGRGPERCHVFVRRERKARWDSWLDFVAEDGGNLSLARVSKRRGNKGKARPSGGRGSDQGGRLRGLLAAPSVCEETQRGDPEAWCRGSAQGPGGRHRLAPGDGPGGSGKGHPSEYAWGVGAQGCVSALCGLALWVCRECEYILAIFFCPQG